jgi:cysteinyl-tRNA synthetase
MKMNVYNSISRQLEELKPLENNTIRLYTCGPTVYNYAHIGNFRAYMFEDILRRTIQFNGMNIRQVMNLTDVDDKTIRGSRAAGIPLCDYTKKYKDAFFEDLKKLNIQSAEVYPAATDHIPEMISLISSLIEKGIAYKSDDGSVYFSVTKFPSYGQLAHIDFDNQRTGARCAADEYDKENVGDFALWKAWEESDGDVVWDSPWGKGRPGWHIECSAMSMKYLGESFDIHTGGVDNMFPHHEDEIAQSESATGKKWVNYWLHCEHLMVDGTKMSKSLGNFYTLRDLQNKGYSGREIRWVLVGAHYRKKLNFTMEALNQARETLGKFDDLFDRLRGVALEGDGQEVKEIVDSAKDAFAVALADDLNIAPALAAAFELMRGANRLADGQKLTKAGAQAVLAAFRDFDRVIGCFEVDNIRESAAIPAEVVALAEARAEARKAKNFAESDRLRDELTKLGYAIKDIPGGAWELKKL